MVIDVGVWGRGQQADWLVIGANEQGRAGGHMYWVVIGVGEDALLDGVVIGVDAWEGGVWQC